MLFCNCCRSVLSPDCSAALLFPTKTFNSPRNRTVFNFSIFNKQFYNNNVEIGLQMAENVLTNQQNEQKSIHQSRYDANNLPLCLILLGIISHCMIVTLS